MNESLAYSYDGDTANEFINTMAFTDLKQFNYIRNANNRILDLLLTNCGTNEVSLTAVSEISKVDVHHPPFAIKITVTDLKFVKPTKTPKLNFLRPITV